MAAVAYLAYSALLTVQQAITPHLFVVLLLGSVVLIVGETAALSLALSYLFEILPLAVSLSFFLIADIDSPRAGVIRVRPQNLYALQQSLQLGSPATN